MGVTRGFGLVPVAKAPASAPPSLAPPSSAQRRDAISLPPNAERARDAIRGVRAIDVPSLTLRTPSTGGAAATVLAEKAIVGARSITTQDVDQDYPTAAVVEQGRSAVLRRAKATPISLVAEPGESDEAFFERACDAVLSEGQWAALQQELEHLHQHALDTTLWTVAYCAVLEATAAERGVALEPRLATEQINDYQRRLEQSLGELIESPSLVTQLEQRTLFALAAPYLSTVNAAFGCTSPADTERVLNLAYGLMPDNPVRAVESFVGELKSKAALHHLAAVARSTRTLTPTLDQLDELSRPPSPCSESATFLLKLLAPNASRRWSLGESTLGFKLTQGAGWRLELVASNTKKNASDLPSLLRSKQLSLSFNQTSSALEATFTSSAEARPENDERMLSIRAELVRVERRLLQLEDRLCAALSSGQPTFAQAVEQSGLAAVVPNAAVFIASSPRLANALHAKVVAMSCGGASSNDIQRGFDRLGIPPELRQLRATERTLAWLEAIPPPPALAGALSGGAALSLPTSTREALNDDQRAALGWLQQQLARAGMITLPSIPGVMDAATSDLLRPAFGQSLDFNRDGAPLLAQLSPRIPITETLLGDMFMSSPVVLRMRATPVHQRVDLARGLLAYLRAVGGDVDIDPPKASHRLATLLERSNKQPVNEQAFARAMVEAASLPPLSENSLRTLFGTTVTLIKAPGATSRADVARIHGSASPEQWQALRFRLQRLAAPVTQNVEPRSHAGLLPVRQPILALRAALVMMRGGDAASLIDAEGKVDAVLTATDIHAVIDLLFPHGKPVEPAAPLYADLQQVLAATSEHRLVIGNLFESVVATTHTSNAEAAAANRVIEALKDVLASIRATTLPVTEASLARTDVLSQAKDPGAAGTQLQAAAASARAHLFTLPGFADSAVANQVEKWRVVELKIERFRAGKGPNPSVRLSDSPPALVNNKGTLELAAAHEFSLQEKAASFALQEVDADFLEFLCDAHPTWIGRSHADTLLSGSPTELPTQEPAVALLRSIARDMRAGRRHAWPFVDIAFSDDANTRRAKLIVQAALRRQRHKDAAEIEGVAKRELGIERDDTASLLKAMLVEHGFLSATAIGPFNNQQVSRDELLATAAFCLHSHQLALGKTKQELYALAAAFVRAANILPTTHVDLSSAPELNQQLQRVLQMTGVGLRQAGALPAFDFSDMFRAASDKQITVVAPLHNSLSGRSEDHGDKSLPNLTELTGQLGPIAPENENARQQLNAWASRAHFDPSKALQTTISSYVLFHHLMHTLISYDLSVAPAHGAAVALGDYAKAKTPEQKAAALNSLVRVGSGVADNLASFTAFYTPVGFAQDVEHEVRQGNLDVAAGKFIVTAPMMWASGRGIAHLVTRLKDKALLRNKTFSVDAFAAEQVTVASTTAVEPSVWRRVTTGALRGGDAVVGLVRDPLATAGEWIGKSKRVVFGERVLRVSGTERIPGVGKPLQQWIANTPEGSIRVSLSRQSKVSVLNSAEHVELHWRNADILEFSRAGNTGKLNASVANRLGLTGPAKSQAHEWLSQLVHEMPPADHVQASATRPTLKQLGLTADASTTFTVTSGGVTKSITLRHSVITRLVRDRLRKTPRDFAAMLRRMQLDTQEDQVMAVLRTYAHESEAAITAADRSALLFDAAERARQSVKEEARRFAKSPTVAADAGITVSEASPLLPSYVGSKAGTGRTLYVVAQPSGPALHVVESKDGKLRARIGQQDVSALPHGRAVLEEVEGFRRTYGTTNGNQLQQFVEIERGNSLWNKRLQTRQALTVAERESFAAFVARTRKAFASDLSGAELASARARFNTHRLEGELFATELVAAMTEAGIEHASAKVVEAAGRTLRGALRSPAFYLAVTIGARELLIDFGHLANSDLTTRQKLVAGLAHAAKAGDDALLAWFAFHVLSTLAPRVAAAVEPAGLAAVAYQATQLDQLLLEVAYAWKGMASPKDAMKAWAAIGIPEARALKLTDADIHHLQSDNRGASPRTHFLYHARPSTLSQRLQQLCGGDERVVWKPSSLQLSNTRHYHEPQSPSLSALERMATLRHRPSHLALQHAGGFGSFEFSSWRDSQQQRCADLVYTVDTKHVKFDEEQMLLLLREQSSQASYSATERAAVERRIKADIATASAFSELLAQTAVPAEERALALQQLLLNLCADHRANAVCHAYLGAVARTSHQQFGLNESEADDWYLYASDVAAGLI